jgi:hypothetical protein
VVRPSWKHPLTDENDEITIITTRPNHTLPGPIIVLRQRSTPAIPIAIVTAKAMLRPDIVEVEADREVVLGDGIETDHLPGELQIKKSSWKAFH